MKAITYTRHGAADVLALADVPTPVPGAGEVRIAVRFAGVNPVDTKLRAGVLPWAPPLPAIPGQDVAGVVESLGANVTDLAIGDEVFGWARTGAYAELATAEVVLRRPAGLNAEQAVALPVAGEAALRGLRLLDLLAGETLLVHGAAGAVGAIAAQLARRRAVTVVGTARAADAEALRELGVIPVAYGPGFADRVRAVVPAVDAVLDAAGAGVLPESIALRGSPDRIVTLADPAASAFGVPFSAGTVDDESTAALTELAVAGLVLPPARVLSLVDAAQAHRLVEAGGVRGKVVLAVYDEAGGYGASSLL